MLTVLLIYEFLTLDLEEQPPYRNPSVTFGRPEMTNRSEGEVVCWEASLEIFKVTPRDWYPPWTRINITIKDSNKTVLDQGIVLRPYDGAIPARTDSVEAWYIDNDGDPKRMGPTDQVILTGLTERYDECVLGFFIEGAVTGPSIVVLPPFEE